MQELADDQLRTGVRLPDGSHDTAARGVDRTLRAWVEV